MKIVLATPMYPPEIAEPAPYIKELSRRLSLDHDVTVVAYASTSEKVPGVELVTIDKRKPLPLRLVTYTTKLFRASADADIIYAQGGTAAGLPALVVGHLRSIPVVIRFSEDEAWERATQQGLTEKNLADFLVAPQVDTHIGLIMKLQKMTLRFSDVVIATSHYQKDTLIREYRIRNTRIETIYNPASKEEIIPLPERKVPYQLALITKLTPWSGVDTAIRAVEILQKDFPEILLLIAGEGPEKKQIESLITELGLEKHVHILGHVSRAENWHLRKTSSAYIETPLAPGSLDKISWSFRAGVPVIASNVPVLVEGVRSGISGVLVEPGNADALAQGIKKIFTDKDFVNALAQGRMEELGEKFSWEAHIKGLERVFLEQL